MTKFFKIQLMFLAFVVAPTVWGADDMKQFMSSADEKVDNIFLGLSRNTRLDMIDYFEAGLEAFSYDDNFGSSVRIDTLEDRHVRLATNTQLAVDFYLIAAGSDSLAVAAVTYPVGDGDVRVFVDDVRTGKTIDSLNPQYSDWLLKDALKNFSESELLAAIPFIAARAEVDVPTAVITLFNTSVTVPGLDPAILKAYKTELRYKWNGKKYVPIKQ